jgi:hypothetical protein
MKNLVPLLVPAVLATLTLTAAPRSTSQPLKQEVRLNGHTFSLPDGFEIELVAGPPLVNRPIVADFDEQGRLYVADSSGSSENVNIQVVKRPHRIVRLEETKGDGKFDKAVVFMTFTAPTQVQTAGFIGAKGPLPNRVTTVRIRPPLSPRQPIFFAVDPMVPVLSPS